MCYQGDLRLSGGSPGDFMLLSSTGQGTSLHFREKKNDIELSINENVVISRKLFIIFSVSSEIQN